MPANPVGTELCGSPEPAAAGYAVRVSVVVPCHNAARTVDATIDSILRNASDDLEIELIAVDDASTDDTLQRLRRRADVIHVIALTENVGVSRARNAGIERASGEFVAFCDADDLWTPDKLRAQLPCFEDPQVGLACSSGTTFHDGEDPASAPRWCPPFKRGWVYEDLLVRNFIGTSTVVVRAKALSQQRFNPDLRHAEDFDLWLRIAREWKVDFVDRPLIHYRMSAWQASRNWKAMQESRLQVIRNHLALRPAPRRARYILSRTLYAYALEHWDARDFAGARRKLVQVAWLDPTNGRAWLRLLACLLPGDLLRAALGLRARLSR